MANLFFVSQELNESDYTVCGAHRALQWKQVKTKETNQPITKPKPTTPLHTPPKPHHFRLSSLSTAMQRRCRGPGHVPLTRPRHPDLPCSSLKRVLSSFSISPRCSSRVSLPPGMAAAARPALPPRRDAQCGEGQASPAVREHRQNPAGQRRPPAGRGRSGAPHAAGLRAYMFPGPGGARRHGTAGQGGGEAGTGRAVRQRPALP